MEEHLKRALKDGDYNVAYVLAVELDREDLLEEFFPTLEDDQYLEPTAITFAVKGIHLKALDSLFEQSPFIDLDVTIETALDEKNLKVLGHLSKKFGKSEWKRYGARIEELRH